jgi:hypothetical protein
MENVPAQTLVKPEEEKLVGPMDPNTIVSGGLATIGAVVGSYALIEHAPSVLRVGVALGALAVGAIVTGARSYHNYRRRQQEVAAMPDGFTYRKLSFREAFSPLDVLLTAVTVVSIATLAGVAEKYINNNSVDFARIGISAAVFAIFIGRAEQEQEWMRVPTGSTIHRLYRRPLQRLPRQRGDH